MPKFYITVGQVEDDDNQETVLLSQEQLKTIFDIPDLVEFDNLTTAIDKILGDSGARKVK